MKLAMALTFLMVLAPSAFAGLPEQILGNWQYDGFIYQQQRYPNPNPRLKVLFTFNSDAASRLFWKRDDEEGFCERKGTWQLNSDRLVQTVTWINPANAPNCGSDPDMQMGRVTENAIAIVGEEMHIFMQLDGHPFIYVLRREPAPAPISN